MQALAAAVRKLPHTKLQKNVGIFSAASLFIPSGREAGK
jgi:hypothetical protein